MGKRIKTGHLDVRVAASPFAYARVGIIVPKYKRSIVERNQLRRRLRELVRTKMLPVIPPCDVYIRSLPHAYGIPFGMLAIDVQRIIDRVGHQSVH
jgi:ribonuclease P protein component